MTSSERLRPARFRAAGPGVGRGSSPVGALVGASLQALSALERKPAPRRSHATGPCSYPTLTLLSGGLGCSKSQTQTQATERPRTARRFGSSPRNRFNPYPASDLGPLPTRRAFRVTPKVRAHARMGSGRPEWAGNDQSGPDSSQMGAICILVPPRGSYSQKLLAEVVDVWET